MPDSQHCSLSCYGDHLPVAVVSIIEILCVHQVALTSLSTLGSLCRPGLCFQSEASLVPVRVVGIRGSLSYLVWSWIEGKHRDLEPVDCEGCSFSG